MCTCEHVPAVGGIPSQITLAHSALMTSWLPEAFCVVLTISLSNTVLLPKLIVISVMILEEENGFSLEEKHLEEVLSSMETDHEWKDAPQ